MKCIHTDIIMMKMVMETNQLADFQLIEPYNLLRIQSIFQRTQKTQIYKNKANQENG